MPPSVLSWQQEHWLSLFIPPLLHRRAAAHLRQPLPHITALHKRAMSEGQSQGSVASSAQHQQKVEVAAVEEHERATAETAATAARVARLAMVELAAARAEVEAAAAVDAARAVVAEIDALRANSTGSSVSVDDPTETTSSSWRGRQRRSRRCSGQPCTRRGATALTGANASAVLWAGVRVGAMPLTAAAAQTGVDAPAAGLTKIAAFTGGVVLPLQTGTMVTMGSRPLSGTSVPTAGGLHSPRPTTSSGPR
jgi:hypothetical protein